MFNVIHFRNICLTKKNKEPHNCFGNMSAVKVISTVTNLEIRLAIV